MQGGATKESSDEFFEESHDVHLERLLIPAIGLASSVSLSPSNYLRKNDRIWQAYFAASQILLSQMLEQKRVSEYLIFPAMFNLRHGMELALKWHIEYAGGRIPKNAGHKLDVLVQAFRETASDLDEDETYISEFNTDLGSGLVDQSQKITVAASAMAEKKTVGQRS